MFYPIFTNISRLFLLLNKNGDNDPARYSFNKFYIPLLEIIDFNVLIDNKPFFDQPVKNKQKAHEILRNDDNATWNILDLLYHQNYYKLIDIDLSRQPLTAIAQQINFLRKFKNMIVQQCFLLLKSNKKRF